MNLFVGNLSQETTDQDLLTIFSEFGEVVSARIIKDNETGTPRGFGFVEMADKYTAFDAIDNLDCTFLQGNIISVKEAKPKASDRNSGGGGRFGNNRGGGGNRFGGGGNRFGSGGGGNRGNYSNGGNRDNNYGNRDNSYGNRDNNYGNNNRDNNYTGGNRDNNYNSGNSNNNYGNNNDNGGNSENGERPRFRRKF